MVDIRDANCKDRLYVSLLGFRCKTLSFSFKNVCFYVRVSKLMCFFTQN